MATTFTSSLSTLLNPKPSLITPPKPKAKLTITSKPTKKTNNSLISFKPQTPLMATSAPNTPTTSTPNDERVLKVHTIADFDNALAAAKSKLVVVEYASIEEPTTQRIYPFMVELSRTCNDVNFLLVMADESDATRQLCDREGVDKVPHFSFYKNKVKIHDEEAIGPDELMGDVLYYGDNHSAVVQLHSRRDVEDLISSNKGKKGKMVVLDVGLKHCGPCVKVYPLVIKLSKSMADVAVFARLNGDENEDCMEFLKEINVVEVPTFLFIKNGEVCGRYVGSGKGELIGEILKYQGVL